MFFGDKSATLPQVKKTRSLTANAPEKWMVGRRSFPFGMVYFQGQAVSFREGTSKNGTLCFPGIDHSSKNFPTYPERNIPQFPHTNSYVWEFLSSSGTLGLLGGYRGMVGFS